MSSNKLRKSLHPKPVSSSTIFIKRLHSLIFENHVQFFKRGSFLTKNFLPGKGFLSKICLRLFCLLKLFSFCIFLPFAIFIINGKFIAISWNISTNVFNPNFSKKSQKRNIYLSNFSTAYFNFSSQNGNLLQKDVSCFFEL